MTARVLPAGDRGLLVETGDLATTLALTSRIDALHLPQVEDLVPASTTVLIRVIRDTDLDELAALVLHLASGPPTEADPAGLADPLVVPVHYDGPDLEDVARETGLSIAAVIAAHTGTPWRAGFVGFAPGFAYLTGGDSRLAVPRRAQSRTSVPAGSVALAGGFSAVYPRQSPGGWQLIGSTDITLWDVDAVPPAAIQPGRWVRFVDASAVGSTADLGEVGVPGNGTPAAGVRGGTAHEHRLASPPGPGAGKSSLTVIRPGPLALIQDAGRAGHAADGVGRSGAADRASHALANRLVGNSADAATVECTLGGLVVRADADLVVAITGAPAPADIDDEAIAHAHPFRLRAGQTLRLRTPKAGLRSYLAVAGGIDVPTVLGSSSSDTLSKLGPAPLAKGDILPMGAGAGSHGAAAGNPRDQPTTVTAEPVLTLRARLGPRDDWFLNPADLAVSEWRVSPHSNRVGLRLDRDPDSNSNAPALQRNDSRELPSEGLTLGAIQVPPSGQPVLFLADHPVTGGYPVIAVVIDHDIDCAAQVRPGQRLRFVIAP